MECDRVISLYREFFTPRNVAVYLYKDLESDTDGTLDQIRSHLGVEKTFGPKKQKLNVGLTSRLSTIIRVINKLMAEDFDQQYFQRNSGQAVDRKEIVRRLVAKNIRRLGELKALGGTAGTVMDSDDRAYIRERFVSSNRRLSELLQRDLKELGYATA